MMLDETALDEDVDGLPDQQLMDEAVYRLAVDNQEPVSEMGAVFADDFDKELSSEPLDEKLQTLIQEPFVRLKHWPQRWNPGFPCFYSALEPETAVDEVCHSVRKAIFDLNVACQVFYLHFSCRFSGKVKDTRAMLEKHPELTHDAHEKCHAVADRIFQRGYDGLIASSVRNRQGNCLPVFRVESLVPGEIFEQVVFERTNGQNAIQVRREPYQEA